MHLNIKYPAYENRRLQIHFKKDKSHELIDFFISMHDTNKTDKFIAT